MNKNAIRKLDLITAEYSITFYDKTEDMPTNDISMNATEHITRPDIETAFKELQEYFISGTYSVHISKPFANGKSTVFITEHNHKYQPKKNKNEYKPSIKQIEDLSKKIIDITQSSESNTIKQNDEVYKKNGEIGVFLIQKSTYNPDNYFEEKISEEILIRDLAARNKELLGITVKNMGQLEQITVHDLSKWIFLNTTHTDGLFDRYNNKQETGAIQSIYIPEHLTGDIVQIYKVANKLTDPNKSYGIIKGKSIHKQKSTNKLLLKLTKIPLINKIPSVKESDIEYDLRAISIVELK